MPPPDTLEPAIDRLYAAFATVPWPMNAGTQEAREALAEVEAVHASRGR